MTFGAERGLPGNLDERTKAAMYKPIPKKRWYFMIPDVISENPRLSGDAKIAWGVLWFHADAEGVCKHSMKRLAKEIGLSPRQARERVHELIRENLVDVMARPGYSNWHVMLDVEIPEEESAEETGTLTESGRGTPTKPCKGTPTPSGKGLVPKYVGDPYEKVYGTPTESGGAYKEPSKELSKEPFLNGARAPQKYPRLVASQNRKTGWHNPQQESLDQWDNLAKNS
jgi:hypothetical protein